jgi:hypothetical protein
MDLARSMTTANLSAEVELIDATVNNAKDSLRRSQGSGTCQGHASMVAFAESTMDLTAFVARQGVDHKRMLFEIIQRIDETPSQKKTRRQDSAYDSEAQIGKWFKFKNVSPMGIVAIILAFAVVLLVGGIGYISHGAQKAHQDDAQKTTMTTKVTP